MGWTHTLGELADAIGAAPVAPNIVFSGVSTDSRRLQPGDVFFALSGLRFDGARFVPEAFAKGAVAAVTRTPDPRGPCLLVPDPLLALQAFAAAHRRKHEVPLLAITGSCGKTSTKDLVAAVLGTKYRVVKTQGNLNNEIGGPLSLLQIDSQTQFAVIEMGANHVGEIARLCVLARPTESLITMIAPAHLEGFGSIENVAKAKGEIISGLPSTGTFYVNADDAWCVRLADTFNGRKISFGGRGDVALESCEFVGPGELGLRVAPVGELRLPLHSRAHAANVLAAVAVGLNHGVTEFQGPLRQACENALRFRVKRVGFIEVLDDSYNANPASVRAALEALRARPAAARFAALGDMLELGSAAGDLHREIGALAGRLGIDHLFAIGSHACDTIAGARSAEAIHAEVGASHEAVAEAIHALARPGDVLLIKGSRGIQMERVLDALEKLQEQGK